ncbi:MAG TPA: ABC transporter substrate-binding protein, partial [Vicinamibacterales bacterium]|nr:ABC transporter substrate-binding protein [Vicinamibacterales bacterium]
LDELADIALQKEGSSGSLGPFIREVAAPEELKVRAFDKYFRGRPQLDEVTYRTYRSVRAAWAALMRDEVDVLHEVTRDAHEFVASERRVRTYSFLRPYIAAVLFNVERPAMRERRLRRALTQSVDRAAIVSNAYRGRGLVAAGPLTPEHWTLAGTEPAIRQFNPESADSVFAALPVAHTSDRMPSRLRFTCLVAPEIEHQPFERIALLLQQQFYVRGIDMQIESVSLAQMQQRVLTGDFDAALFEFFGRSPSWLYAFWHSRPAAFGGLIGSGYSAADAELEAMQFARDEVELKRAVAAVYKKMHDDPPAIFIAWPEVTRAVSTRFEVPVEKGRDVLGANLWRWKPAGER